MTNFEEQERQGEILALVRVMHDAGDVASELDTPQVASLIKAAQAALLSVLEVEFPMLSSVHSHGVASILATGKMMERLKRHAQGDLSQSELEVIKRVFDLATTQSWFDDTQYSREGFAAALVDLFRCGMVNPTQLERIAMFWALSDFSQSMSNAQRAKLRSLYGRCEVER